MAAVKEYKCLNCSAELKFDPPSGHWKCEYCFSEFTKEQLDSVDNLEEHEELDIPMEELESYHCTSCGAELIADNTTSATFCLYCKSPTIIKERFSGEFKPRYVIPFKLTKENAVEKYTKFIRKKLLAPTLFKKDEEIEKLTGIYAPFWLFDCHAFGETSGEATKVTTWSSGDYRYTKTKFYHVERHGQAQYQKVPIDSSTKLDDKFMQMIEPYSYAELVDFAMQYMSGFMAEKYDVDAYESEKVMKARVDDFVTTRLKAEVNGYTSYSQTSHATNLTNLKNEYALMPVYLLINKYKDKDHIFLVNGQTGKVVGDTPIDKGKQISLFAVVAVVTFIIGMIGGGFFG